MLKRVVPFLLTLAVGLFIASFFVDLKPRAFAFTEGRRARCRNFESMYYQEHDRAERLQQQLDQLQQNATTLELKLPPPPPRLAKIPPNVVR